MTATYKLDILKLLNSFLADADKYVTDLPNDLILAQKQIINFQNEIIQFLDYAYTNFPTDENSNKRAYFPRPKYLEDESSFISNFKSQKTNTSASSELVAFLGQCYSYVAEHQFSISLIEPSAKHEKPHTVSPSTTMSHSSRDPRAVGIITYLEDGSIDIGPGAIRIGAGSTEIRLMDININGVQIDSLTIFRVGNGQNVTFYLPKNSGTQTVKYVDWAKGCLKTCEDIYSLITK